MRVCVSRGIVTGMRERERESKREHYLPAPTFELSILFTIYVKDDWTNLRCSSTVAKPSARIVTVLPRASLPSPFIAGRVTVTISVPSVEREKETRTPTLATLDIQGHSRTQPYTALKYYQGP